MKKIVGVSALLFLLLISLAFFALKQPDFSKEKIEVDSSMPIDTNILKQHVTFFTSVQPARNFANISSLDSCANYIFSYLKSFADTVYFQEFTVEGKLYKNVIASYGSEFKNRLIVGAHYDVCEELPGADDNASGVAGLLEIGKALHGKTLNKRVDLVAYTLEEPPFFRTNKMGSAIHAESIIEDRSTITGMICLEMIGYFSDEKNSQDYPIAALKLVYPNIGNFITVVGRSDQSDYTQKVRQLMKAGSSIPVESINAPAALSGIDFSDHLNYWKNDFNAVMISNTGFYRNHNYHTADDTMEKLNFAKMALVTQSVIHCIINF